jgi:hypothetical protein
MEELNTEELDTNFLKDILENATSSNEKDGNEPKKILSGDAFEIRYGEILLMYSKFDMTHFLIALAVAMMEAGRTFLNVVCETACPVIYANGNKAHPDLAMIERRFNGGRTTELKLLSEDILPAGNKLNFMNPVLQERTLEYLESSDVKVIFFDDSISLLREPIDKDALPKLRNFIIQLRQLGVLQIWALTHEKNKIKFPSELATKVWNLTPGKDLTTATLDLQILKDIHRPAEATKSMTLEIRDTEESLTIANASAERPNRLTAMLLLTTGKTQEDVGKILDVHQTTVHHWVKRFKNKGWMSQSGRTYTLTEAGQEYLGSQTS